MEIIINYTRALHEATGEILRLQELIEELTVKRSEDTSDLCLEVKALRNQLEEKVYEIEVLDEKLRLNAEIINDQQNTIKQQKELIENLKSILYKDNSTMLSHS